jgi:hypothetical protein
VDYVDHLADSAQVTIKLAQSHVAECRVSSHGPTSICLADNVKSKPLTWRGLAMPEIAGSVSARIGKGVKRLRHASGLTQTSLSKRIGWPQSKIAEIEGGKRRMYLDDFLILLDALGADPVTAMAAISPSKTK